MGARRLDSPSPAHLSFVLSFGDERTCARRPACSCGQLPGERVLPAGSSLPQCVPVNSGEANVPGSELSEAFCHPHTGLVPLQSPLAWEACS